MPRVPYKYDPDDGLNATVIRLIAAVPMPAVALAAVIVGSALGWAVAS